MNRLTSLVALLLLAAGLRAQNVPHISPPGLAAGYLRDAADHYEKGEYDEAIQYCDEAIQIDPELADAYFGRGAAWDRKGEYEKALADYGEALRIDPRRAEVYSNRGIVWDELNEFDKAIVDYNQAIRLNPNLADAYYGRGTSWYAKGEYDKAIADYNRAIRINPKFAMGYRLRGVAWDGKGEYGMAIADYNEAIRIEPGYAMAYYCRGFAHFNHYLHELAMRDFETANRLNPKYAYAALGLAMTRMRMGVANYASLLDNGAKTLGEDWPMPVIRFYTGQLSAQQLLAAVGNPDAAKQKNQLCEAEFYLGEWQLAHGQRHKAIASLEQARSVCRHDYYEYVGAVKELMRTSPAAPAKPAH